MEGMEVPHECAVKVFKTTLNEFKTRDRYIKDDHRFKDRLGKQNPRKTIKLWAEKEMCNLSRFENLFYSYTFRFKPVFHYANLFVRTQNSPT